MKKLLLITALCIAPVASQASELHYGAFYTYLEYARMMALAGKCGFITMPGVALAVERLRPRPLDITEITMVGLSEDLGYGDTGRDPGVCDRLGAKADIMAWITKLASGE